MRAFKLGNRVVRLAIVFFLLINAGLSPAARVVHAAGEPVILSITMPTNDIYGTARPLTFELQFDQTVYVDTLSGAHPPQLPVEIGGETVYANYQSGTTGQWLIFGYTPVPGDSGPVTLTEGAELNLNGGTITNDSAVGALLTLPAAPPSDITVDTTRPKVTGITVFAPLGHQTSGTEITFTVEFDQLGAFVRSGQPRLAFKLGGEDRTAAFDSDASSGSLIFRYLIAEPDGGPVSDISLTANGAAIRNQANYNTVDLSTAAITPTSNVNVDTQAPQAALTVPADGLYRQGQTLIFTVNFDEPVTGSDQTRLTISLGETHPPALAPFSSSSTEVVYQYRVGDYEQGALRIDDFYTPAGLGDGNGNSFDLAGFKLTFPNTAGVTVDGTLPVLTQIETPPTAEPYQTGAILEFVVHYSGAVTVTGTPRLPLSIGGRPITADYQPVVRPDGGLVFHYPADGTESGLFSIPPQSAIDLNGGSMLDANAIPVSLDLTGVPLRTSQTITFNPPASRALGSGPLTLSGTASSGLAVSYEITQNPAVCAVSGSTVTLLSVGWCEITARQGGDAAYAAAQPVARTLTVDKAEQTITFRPLSDKVTTDPDFELTAEASSHLAVSFAVTGGAACTLTGSTVHITGAGSCEITASQAGSPTYNPAPPVIRSFNVTKADQTITFGPLSDKVITDPDFNVSAAASSGLAVSFSAAGGCTVSGALVHLAQVGGCTITAEQAGSGIYNPAEPVSRTFNITQAAQTITFNPLADKTYGDAPFTLTASTTAPLTVSYTITQGSEFCAVTGSTLTILGAGACEITAEQAGNAAYAPAAPVARTLTVHPAGAGLTLGGLTATYTGSAHPATVTTNPPGLEGAVTFTYNGQPDAPTGAGSYSVVATLNHVNYTGTASGTLTIAKADQTITFGALGDKIMTDADFAVSASATSALAIAYSVSGDCAISGNVVHLVKAGSCTVTAWQAGGTNYNPAAPVSRTFNISKAAQTITFNPLTDKTYGDAPFTLTASTTAPLAVSYSVTQGSTVCAVTGSTLTILAAGTCQITAAQAGDGSYTAATAVAQTLTIHPAAAAITLSAADLSAVYNGQPHPVTFTIAPANLAGDVTVTYNGLSTAPTLAGSYSVTAALDNPNYTGTVTGTLTIAKADQAITFGALGNKTYGDPDFTLTATTTSLLPIVYTVTGAACQIVAGSQVHMSAAGSCLITASHDPDPNYNPVTPVQQAFTVNKAPQTITLIIPAPANAMKGTSFTVEAGVAAGLPITYTSGSLSICTNVGPVYTMLTDTGSCLVRYNQPGDANYLPAPQVTETVTATSTDLAGPTVTSVLVPAARVYDRADDLQFIVNFNEITYVTGAPRLSFMIGAATVQANFRSGSGSTALIFGYTVAQGDDGPLTMGALDLNDGTLRDTVGNDASLSLHHVASLAGLVVDTLVPAVTGVTYPAGGTYAAGDGLTFQVRFDEAVTVTGAPHLALKIGQAAVQADYVSGSGTATLVFRYTVPPGYKGVVSASALQVGGGAAITDAYGKAVKLALNNAAGSGDVTVDSLKYIFLSFISSAP